MILASKLAIAASTFAFASVGAMMSINTAATGKTIEKYFSDFIRLRGPFAVSMTFASLSAEAVKDDAAVVDDNLETTYEFSTCAS